MSSIKTPNNTKKSNKKLVFITIGLAVFALLSIAGMYTYNNFIVNYAKNEAKPIETALIKAGAVKKCEQGDGGHGPDNFKPHHTALYELPGNQQQASDTVKEIAAESNFSLVDTSDTVNAEGSIHLRDDSSKKSTYSNLEDGNIDLSFVVYDKKATQAKTA